jgi:hypothetical protein
VAAALALVCNSAVLLAGSTQQMNFGRAAEQQQHCSRYAAVTQHSSAEQQLMLRKDPPSCMHQQAIPQPHMDISIAHSTTAADALHCVRCRMPPHPPPLLRICSPHACPLLTAADTYRKNVVLSIQESIVNHVEYTLARTRHQFDDFAADALHCVMCGMHTHPAFSPAHLLTPCMYAVHCCRHVP